jgi:hypothetical protein
MADPTLKLDFASMQVRVAEYLGIQADSGSGAAVPTDASDLDLVKRLVNDGYRRFITEQPWNFLVIPLSLTFLSGTVSSDNSRYYLPDDFYGVLEAPFTYPSTGPRRMVEQVSEVDIRQFIAGAGTMTGDPYAFCVRPIATTETATAARWEAVFFPTPSTAYAMKAAYRRFPAALSTSTDRSVAGFQHDDTVLAAALAAAELQKHDKRGEREASYQAALERSKMLDKQVRKGKFQMSDCSDVGGRTSRPSKYFGPDTYNGVTLTT